MKAEILRLSRRIIAAAKQDPPSIGLWMYSFWLSKHFWGELDYFEAIEKRFGERRCNAWLSRLLRYSSTSSGGG